VSTRQKVLLIGLAVVLVVLYLVAVGGGHPGQGSAKGHHGFLERLGKLGGKRGNVDPDTVTGDCVQPGHTVKLTGPCVLHVADPGSTKLLVLRAAVPFVVTAPSGGGTATDEVDVDDKGVARTQVAIDKASNVLVTCGGGLTNGCVLTIGDE